MTDQTSYQGTELELFQYCVRWKSYMKDLLAPVLHGSVLEVGAGIGGTTRQLIDQPAVEAWTALEPDDKLLSMLVESLGEHPRLSVVVGTLDSLNPEHRFDTVLYVDVLEHIEHDRRELERVESLLSEGGKLAVLAPAHNWLYTPFDKSIGHYRRYARDSLKRAAPATLQLEFASYVDSVGLLASLSNRLFLRQAMPTSRQLEFWDRWLIPASRHVDRLTRFRIGKSILAVWKKTG